MLISRSGFRAFTQYDLRANLDKFISDLRTEVEADRNVTVVPIEDYVREKVALKAWAPLVLKTEPDDIEISEQEVAIPGRYFPSNFFVEAHESYPKPVITFHVPFEGPEDLLHCRPSTMMLVSEEIAVENGHILFETVNFNNDADAVKRQRDEILSRLKQMAEYVNNDIANYNSQLENVVRGAHTKGNQRQQEQSAFLDSLGNKKKDA